MKQKIIFAALMGIITTGIISFTLIAFNAGVHHDFVYRWMKSWLLAYVIAVPAILVIAPRVEQFVQKKFKTGDHKKI